MSANSRAFTFGKNWKKFLCHYTAAREATARDAMLAFLELPDMKGKSFLDIGSGSGIHSAAALQAGASHVVSFDYDPDSVSATQAMHAMKGAPAHWRVMQGSVLDAPFTESLGTFDIVYSWGVLHHTGDLWNALRNAATRMHEGSRLYIALYAKEHNPPSWQHWIEVKQRYNRAGWLAKRAMETAYIWQTYLGRDCRKLWTLPRLARHYAHARGMTLMTDVRDWLGGWPTAFSSVEEVVTLARDELGLSLVNLRTGEPNSEYLFVRRDDVAAMGLSEITDTDNPMGLTRLDTMTTLPKGPIWIFGTAHGGDLIHDYLRQRGATLGGFIDLAEPEQTRLHGLPCLSLTQYAALADPSSPIILANRYVRENAAKLRKLGFTQIINGHPLIMKLHFNEKVG